MAPGVAADSEVGVLISSDAPREPLRLPGGSGKKGKEKKKKEEERKKNGEDVNSDEDNCLLLNPYGAATAVSAPTPTTAQPAIVDLQHNKAATNPFGGAPEGPEIGRAHV